MACKRLDAMVGATLSYDAGSRAYTSVALEGGSGDTITSGNDTTSKCGNVIASTNNGFE